MGTTFCVKNRIIKLFPKFIDFEKKIWYIRIEQKRKEIANYAVKEKYDEKELDKEFKEINDLLL